MDGGRVCLNVRRLMYQPLICRAMAGDDPRRLAAPFDAEDLERLANALVDGVRRNAEFAGDFLGGEVLVDQQKQSSWRMSRWTRCSIPPARALHAPSIVTFRHAAELLPPS